MPIPSMFFKKLCNEMEDNERQSDRKIDGDKYYVLVVKRVEGEDTKILNTLRKEYEPIAVYVNSDGIIALFSKQPEGHHRLDGSHHLLCSDVASCLAVKLKRSPIHVNLVELDSKIQVLAYFNYKVHKYLLSVLTKAAEKKLSGDKLKQFSCLSEKEMIDKIGSKMSNETKYGKFINLKGKEMSESIDFRQPEKYDDFFFSQRP